jgi:triacylglycerol lipase
MNNKCVILIHGFSRTKLSMSKLEEEFSKKDFDVVNRSYSTINTNIVGLASKLYDEFKIQKENYDKVYFVGHSLGGIIICCMMKMFNIFELDGVVLIASPVNGSSYTEYLVKNVIINTLLSPVIKEFLDKKHMSEICKYPESNLMVIAGTKDLDIYNPNSWISQFVIEKPNDGTVTVEETKLPGMEKFITVDSTHTIIMKNSIVIDESIKFLESR